MGPCVRRDDAEGGPSWRATVADRASEVRIALRWISSILATRPPVALSRRLFGAGVIWIDDALCGAARCRHVALCQRGIAAFEIEIRHASINLQADRILRIIGLGQSRRRRQNRRDCRKSPKPECASESPSILTLYRLHRTQGTPSAQHPHPPAAALSEQTRQATERGDSSKLGKIDSGIEALDLPGSFTAKIDLIKKQPL